MAIYCVQTLIDISDSGNLNQAFPFKTKSGDLVHDKQTLSQAKDQKHNFNTLIQSLQLRANITWDQHPISNTVVTANTNFGKVYEGKHRVWCFIFYTDQNDVYADTDGPTGAIEKDLDLIPIISFCKETATFPQNAFLTQDNNTRNTFVLKVEEKSATEKRDMVKGILSQYEN